ncbi:DUF5698 domain-containing protein [Marispirochaeta sp.]|uniref:DUF5698 domain-containing protein n=1 Tax=Marispirochaeta sp. TaxID=2038653 RepID=UPI003747A7E8
MFASRGKQKDAPLIGFFEILLWLIVTQQVLTGMSNQAQCFGVCSRFLRRYIPWDKTGKRLRHSLGQVQDSFPLDIGCKPPPRSGMHSASAKPNLPCLLLYVKRAPCGALFLPETGLEPVRAY